MALDPRSMRPADVVRLLNSADLVVVIDERQLYRHRSRAGFRIGDGKRVDLLRYLGWLVDQVHGPQDERPVADYEAKKEAARSRNAAIARAGRDIAPMPEVVDGDRKAQARASFKFFCETYFPLTFNLGWSDDHLRVIGKIEQAVLHGGLFAMAMPRGSGKTTLAECACLWAMLHGHRDFVCLIGSDEAHAQGMLESIKTELEANDLLADDFPEVCHPIRSLEGIANRCSGQLFNGKRTQIGWTASEIVLPTLEGSDASGAIIRVAGITGRIRGMKFKRPDGHTVRPSLVILDDPQTDESARSLSQCANRERIIAGAVLGLAGPGKKISGIMPCTVIRPGDMADSVLDRDKHPEWNGERTRMVLTFPTSEKLWDQYANIRADCLRAKGTIEDATAFYIKHRDRMDAGASVAWPDRYNHDEASAIQHAMNLKLQDEAAFWAEYQNEPLPEDLGAEEQLTVDDIASKLNGLPRRRVPLGVDHLTAFVDVQGKLLYWVVCGWREDFSGFVIDYGTEPDQRRRYFTLRDASPTLQSVAPGVGLEGTILQGLNRLADRLLEKPWQREDGAELRIDRFLIDANWGTSTDVVYQFCRSHKQAALLLPSHGRYVGASSIPFSDYKRKRGDRLGLNWRMPSVAGKRAIRHLVFDANYWKSFIHARLAVPLGDRSGLSLFGRDPHQHRLLAEHCTAEYRVKTEGRGRTVDEWKLRPEASDNHWWDGLVGCAVAASMLGINLSENQPAIPGREHRRIKLSEIRR
jgi:hypothetical protein